MENAISETILSHFSCFFPIYHGRISETLSSIVTPLLQKLSGTCVSLIKTKRKEKVRQMKKGREEGKKEENTLNKKKYA